VCQRRNRSADYDLDSVFATQTATSFQLADKIVTLMEREKISLADLLMGLEEERKAIWQERQANGPSLKAG
jgi:hypothetical protein